MRALLLAAGIGSRLRPITDTLPKCLVTINGRPLLEYWLRLLLSRAGFDRVLINTHHLAGKVQDFVGDSEWKERIDLVHEEALLGTGGTIKANLDYFRGEEFLVAHADNLTDFDAAHLVRRHRIRPSHCVMTMLTFRTNDPSSCGIVELDGDAVVTAFHEKVPSPPGNLANAAVYILGHQMAHALQEFESGVVDFSTQVIPRFLGRILTMEHQGYHRDIGTVDSLRRARAEFRF